jgi:hypothetical protein
MKVIADRGLETHVNTDIPLLSFLSYSSLSSVLRSFPLQHIYLYILFRFS